MKHVHPGAVVMTSLTARCIHEGRLTYMIKERVTLFYMPDILMKFSFFSLHLFMKRLVSVKSKYMYQCMSASDWPFSLHVI